MEAFLLGTFSTHMSYSDLELIQSFKVQKLFCQARYVKEDQNLIKQTI